MAVNKTSSAEVTDMTNQVSNEAIAPAEDTGDISYICEWTRWLGFYKGVPDLQSSIDKKAFWTVGKGYKTSEKNKKILSQIKGNGKETFNSILYNIVKTYTIGGDYFGEIVRNKKNQLINIKTMNPGCVEVVANKYGIISKYILHIDKKNNKKKEFEPENVLHLPWNKIGDDIHGLGTIEKLTSDNQDGVIEMQWEAMKDLKIVFHRYVKPLLISEIDEDDPDEVKKFRQKLDRAVDLGENMVIPKDTATVERVSIPQYSTLDPLPWLNHLDRILLKAEGVPAVVLGDGQDATEATAKILYLAFEQMVKWNQMFLEEQLYSQLGIEINLEFPASLDEQQQQGSRGEIGAKTTKPGDNIKKERKNENMELKNGAVK